MRLSETLSRYAVCPPFFYLLPTKQRPPQPLDTLGRIRNGVGVGEADVPVRLMLAEVEARSDGDPGALQKMPGERLTVVGETATVGV